jgi:molybdopterin-dependent oxidoreductase alpha subunit
MRSRHGPPPDPPKKKARRFAPELWAGLVPNGLNQQKPNHYLEMAQTMWQNKRHPKYAWDILNKGVCDGCALGVAGFHDWTIDGIHLCTTRLNLLQVNTMGALDPKRLAKVQPLRELDGAALRKLGRLAYPMLRKRGEPGFRRISWDEALTLAAARIRATTPDRLGFYLTARGITNEVYYVAQKVARFLGTNNIDNAARICHAPSTGALKKSLGVAATTCSYTDVIESDLTVIFGADVANAQPVFMKYLYMARKRGGKVAVVNPFREPGLERYWVPSNPESAIFGTRIADEFFPVNVGGDTAFLNGVLKLLIEEGGVDSDFIAEHTSGFNELRSALATQSLDDLARFSGSSIEDLRRFARIYSEAKSSVLVWSMGITQHVCGTDNVQAIINLALARGNVGRSGAGLMPIRGHSGVQGGAEMGAYATVFPGGVPITEQSADALEAQYRFPIGGERGLSAAEMVEAAGRGEMDVLWSSGGNFLDTLPDPASVHEALERVPLRVHQDILVSSQMLVDPGEDVLLLPAATRYEQRDGGTETTTERRVAFSPEIPHPRIGEARSEWLIFLDLARFVDPARWDLVAFASGQQIREEIARVVPFYDGIQSLSKTGDQVQWGGERLCDGWVFPTPDGKAHFTVVQPREVELDPGRFLLSTRRGKQFNTMVWKKKDPLTGARRDDLFISESDARALELEAGDRVAVRSETGAVEARVRISDIRPGNVQMFFPEANPLIRSGQRDPVALVPDYNATVSIERLFADASETSATPWAYVARDLPPPESSSTPAPARRPSTSKSSVQTPPASGIVLAGGRSSRFGSNKMAAELDGVPLLHRAILALASVCTEVVVVASPDGLNMALPSNVPVPVRVALDPRPFEGPLVGTLAGLEEANESLAVVVGGDMPELQPAVIRQMLKRMVGPADATGRRDGYWDAQGVALQSGGKPRPLPLVLDRTAALPGASDLIAIGIARLSALLDVLDVAVLPEEEWRALDPESRTLRDIDLPGDLA